MRISVYPNERSSVAETREFTTDRLVELLTTHIERTPKQGPAWSPAELKPCPDGACVNASTQGQRRFDCGGGQLHRHEKNVLRHSVVVFDIDHQPEATAEEIIRSVQAMGLRAVVHSTHSHTPPNDCCLRVVLFPDRDIEAAEVRKVRAVLVAGLDIADKVDPATKDLSRLYYLPAYPPGTTPFALAIDGDPFDVAACVAADAPAPSAPAPASLTAAPGAGPGAGTVDLETLRERLKEVDTSPEAKAIVKRILKGDPIAEPGARDNTLQRVAGLLATWLPDGTSYEGALALIETSLRRMPGDEGFDHWAGEFEDMYQRAVERTREYRAEQRAATERFKASFRKELAEKALDPLVAEADENGNYSPAALQEWSIGDREWVIQKGDTYFVFVDGHYRPRGKSEYPNSVHRDLARSGLTLDLETKKGSRELTPTEILRAYGSVANKLESHLTLQRSYYDPSTGVFHEAVCPQRPIQARSHPEIQTWLEIFGGADKEKLLDWVATSTRLDRQTCALYLHGPGGTGKTLLPQGLSRIWTPGAPADLKLVLSGFNEILCGCPLVFADEKLPPSKTISEDLRELVGTAVRVLTRKFMPPSSLHGAVRLVVSGNNPDLLRPQGDMSEFDLDAVSERFLFIEVPIEAREYLDRLGGQPVLDAWIRNDMIAEHALWLAAHRQVEASGRFLVTGARKRFHERLAVNSGAGSGVCEVLVKHLTSSKPMLPGFKDCLLVGEGHVFANVAAIEALWPDAVKSTDLPNVQRLSKALAAISHSVEKIRVNGQQRNYAHVRLDQLMAWAEENGLSSTEQLKAKVDAPSEVVTEILQRRDPIRTRKPREEAVSA